MIGAWLNRKGRVPPVAAAAVADAEEARLLLWLREVERVQAEVDAGRQDLAPRLGLRQRYVIRVAESLKMREVAA